MTRFTCQSGTLNRCVLPKEQDWPLPDLATMSERWTLGCGNKVNGLKMWVHYNPTLWRLFTVTVSSIPDLHCLLHWREVQAWRCRQQPRVHLRSRVYFINITQENRDNFWWLFAFNFLSWDFATSAGQTQGGNDPCHVLTFGNTNSIERKTCLHDTQAFQTHNDIYGVCQYSECLTEDNTPCVFPFKYVGR